MGDGSEPGMPQKLGRKGFLGLAGVTGVALGAGAYGLWATRKNQEGISQHEAAEREKRVFSKNGVNVYADGNDVPTRWEDKNNGREGMFDREVVKEAVQRAAKEFRTATVAAEIVAIHADEQKEIGDKIVEAPHDVVSPEVLKQRGIEIINGERYGVHFRQGAFEPGGMLEDYKVGGERKLAIIVTDYSSLMPFVFDDHKYDKYREVIMKQFQRKPQTPAEVREEVALNLRQSDLYDRDLLAALWEKMPDEEIIEQGLYPGTDGYYTPDGHEGGAVGESVLRIALGGRGERRYEHLRVNVRPDGKFEYMIEQVTTSDLRINTKAELGPEQSYPNPDDFELSDEYNKYGPGKLWGKYKTRHQGFSFRHEVAHDFKLHNPSGNAVQDWSESRTDETAAKWLSDARKKWEESGDDSGYSLVLENKEQGFFVMT